MFIYIPSKNIKTSFASDLKQSLASFNFMNYNLAQIGEKENFYVIDNNQEHSIRTSVKLLTEVLLFLEKNL
ncbi:hypothetical protein [Bacillus sp. S14(2024)]|uniref:hypothetical protein n=1 Tax=Bacillus sp. S14(2024) TaxID=3162884 RepID=UPI003D1F3762